MINLKTNLNRKLDSDVKMLDIRGGVTDNLNAMSSRNQEKLIQLLFYSQGKGQSFVFNLTLNKLSQCSIDGNHKEFQVWESGTTWISNSMM